MPKRLSYYGTLADGGGYRPVQLGSQFKFGDNAVRDFFARLGKVIRVDEENGVVDLAWLDFGGVSNEVPIALPYATRRGAGHGMPTRGAIALCVFTKYSQRIGKPYIVGWLKTPWAGAKSNNLDTGFGTYSVLSQDVIVDQRTITLAQRIGSGAERHRLRKTHPGDVHWISDHGGELYLDENAQLMSAALDEFVLRADDQTASLITGTSRVATEAGRRRFGIAYRNDVVAWKNEEFDEEGEETETDDKDGNISSVRRKLTFDSRILPVVTRAGKFLYIPTPLANRDTVDAGGTPWVEDITEIREVADLVKDVCEEVHDHDLDPLYPPSSVGDNHTDIFIRRVLGTYLGNDPTDKKSYGVPLYRRIFSGYGSWQPDAPGKEHHDPESGDKKETSTGPKWVPINRTYFEGKTIEEAESAPKAGLGEDESRLRIRENQEASLLHTEFAHTGQFGRNADFDSVRNTAFDITKEGVLQFLISASSDEHAIVGTEGSEESEKEGAWKSSGRSVEGHFEGSVKLSHGANTNEEESFRQTALGKCVTLWGASEHHFGEDWKDKKREDVLATAFIMDDHPGQDGGGPGKQVLELKSEGETEQLDWPVLPTGLKVANRRRSERRSTWGGLDWFLGRTVDNRTSWNLATAGQIKQWIGATPAPETVNDEEAEATNIAGRAHCSVIRHTVGSVEEHIGKNEKDESWNTVFDGQIKHRVGFTEDPDKNTQTEPGQRNWRGHIGEHADDEDLDVVGPNGPGRVKNSINRQILGSVEEHVGVNDKEETYNAVFDGQVKHRIGLTTVSPEERLNTEQAMLVKGPNGPGRIKNSITREILGSVEEHVGVNDQEESYNAVLDGQLKIRIGVTTTPPAKRRNTSAGLDTIGPSGPGDKGNSVNLQLLGSFEANVGKNQTMGDSVYINSLGGWDINILAPDNANKAMNLLANGDWSDSISGKQTRTIAGEYSRTAAKHTLVGDVAIIGNLSVTGNVTVTGDITAGGNITDSDGVVHDH